METGIIHPGLPNHDAHANHCLYCMYHCLYYVSMLSSESCSFPLSSWRLPHLLSTAASTSPVGYELERRDSPGQAVDLSSTLESQGTLDFILVKNIGKFVLSTSCALLCSHLQTTSSSYVVFQVDVPPPPAVTVVTPLTLPWAEGGYRPQ